MKLVFASLLLLCFFAACLASNGTTGGGGIDVHPMMPQPRMRQEEEVLDCMQGTATLRPGDSYTIRSKNYPNANYPDSVTCYYDIELPANVKMHFYCPAFSLYVEDDAGDCQDIEDGDGDFLHLYQPSDEEDRVNRKFCGKDLNEMEATVEPMDTWRHLYIDFFTDTRHTERGFECHVMAEPKMTPAPPPTVETTTLTPPPPATPEVPPVPGKCTCGIRNTAGNGGNRIIGGQATEVNEYPWQVALVRGDFPNCGGTIINERYVLTAAHCLRGGVPDTVRAGNYLMWEQDPDEKNVKVKRAVKHPRWNPQNIDYDMALLELEEDLDLDGSEAYGAACLPSNPDETYAGEQAVVTGWGDRGVGQGPTEFLMEAQVTVTPPDDCGNYPKRHITESMICAAAPDKDSCQGDSGGPLVVRKHGRYYLAGVVSWGWGCANPGLPGVYARVTEGLQWIKDITADVETCSP